MLDWFFELFTDSDSSVADDKRKSRKRSTASSDSGWYGDSGASSDSGWFSGDAGGYDGGCDSGGSDGGGGCDGGGGD